MRRYAQWPTTIVRNGFELGAVQDEDVQPIREWRNAQLDVLRQNALIGEQEQEEYFRIHVWPEMPSPTPGKMLLSLRRGGSLIGYGGLVYIAWRDARAEVSFLVQPDIASDPSGYEDCFSQFLAMIKDIAFRELDFNRLFTETYAHRHLHIEMLEAAGFLHEGTMREHVVIDGKPTDSLIHGCLATDEG